MNKIIAKAIEGGYPDYVICGYDADQQFVCDLAFWQALGKACGWGVGFNLESMSRGGSPHTSYGTGEWKIKAMKFHEINLTESWGKAIAWLEKLVIETK